MNYNFIRKQLFLKCLFGHPECIKGNVVEFWQLTFSKCSLMSKNYLKVLRKKIVSKTCLKKHRIQYWQPCREFAAKIRNFWSKDRKRSSNWIILNFYIFAKLFLWTQSVRLSQSCLKLSNQNPESIMKTKCFQLKLFRLKLSSGQVNFSFEIAHGNFRPNFWVRLAQIPNKLVEV